MLAVVAGVSTACGRERPAPAAPGAVLRVGVSAEPQTLLPPFVTDLVGGEIADLLYGRLADPSPGGSPLDPRTYRPDLATRWTWNADSSAITFEIDPSARWHDGVPVTSADVRFTYALLADSSVPGARAGAARLVDSIATPDEQTAVIWLRHRGPTAFHDLTYRVHVLPAHVLDTIPRDRLAESAAANRMVGSGPFRFVRWDRGRAIVLAAGRRPRMPSAPGASMVVFRVLPSPETAVLALQGGDVDVLDYVRPQDAHRLLASTRGRAEVRLLALPSYDYAFLEFNLRSPGAPGRPHAVFGERAVRRAFAMAVDRQALVTNVLGAYGRTALGPVTRAQATADTSPGAAALPPYDAAGARTLLDALGWHIGPNGIRQRAGANLAFDVLVPTSSANRRHAAVVLQAMFRAVGADMRIHSVDAAAMGAALEAGTFDAALQALRVDPSPSQIRDVWTTSAGRRTRGSPAGFNYGGYSNARVDAWIDSASVVTAPGEALRLYRQSYAAITADAPAIFLYEPVGLVAYDSRWRPVGVRPDAWWAGLERWSRRDVPEPRTR